MSQNVVIDEIMSVSSSDKHDILCPKAKTSASTSELVQNVRETKKQVFSIIVDVDHQFEAKSMPFN